MFPSIPGRLNGWVQRVVGAARRASPTCSPRRGAVERLEPRVLLSVGAEEQLFVYMLNRARHDPVAYQQEQSLSVDLSYVTARGPLAVNDSLFGSSGFHAEEMATYDYFGHQSQVTGDWPNKMARDYGYALPSWWTDNNNYIESIAAGGFASYALPTSPLNALIVDAGVPSLGHRNHLLGIDSFNAQNREIGVGYGYNAASYYQHYWAIHATYSDTADTFLTGVVFSDANGNQRYDLHEGIAGATVDAGAGLTATTNAQGGWSIQAAGGTYTVSVSGGGFSGTATAHATIGGENVEVDFISGRTTGYVDFEADSPAAAATIGLYNPTVSTFLLRNSNDSGTANLAFAYGAPAAGWKPITGDFNGDGTETVGLYAPESALFLLRNANSSGFAELYFAYGAPGSNWLPVAGDFDGDGTDTIGLYCPDTSVFLLRNSNNAGVADVYFTYGAAGAGWLPIVGDFDGDGTDTVGLYNPDTSAFLLRNSNTAGFAELNFAYGPAGAGWLPLVGDWNGAAAAAAAPAVGRAPEAAHVAAVLAGEDLPIVAEALSDPAGRLTSGLLPDGRRREPATAEIDQYFAQA
ncbi:MAG: hypothetical protein JXB62_07090 [Pirellulales bacterium]|nr:hypothetical protein [Pirellulales bacterium]